MKKLIALILLILFSAKIHASDEKVEILNEVSKGDLSFLREASDKLKLDKVFMKKAINMNPKSLRYASDFIKKDKNIVLLASKLDGETLRYANIALWEDKEIIKQAIQSSEKIKSFNLKENLNLEGFDYQGMAEYFIYENLYDSDEKIKQLLKERKAILNKKKALAIKNNTIITSDLPNKTNYDLSKFNFNSTNEEIELVNLKLKAIDSGVKLRKAELRALVVNKQGFEALMKAAVQ